MTNQNLGKTALLALLFLFCGIFSTEARAQSDQALRQENRQLKQQVEDLNRQLEQSQRRIDDLERQVQMLTEAMQQAGQTTALPPAIQPRVTIDESNADASPRALLWSLEKDYAEALAEEEIGKYGDRHRSSYLRAVERWVSAANRKYKTKIKWHVKFFEEPLNRNPNRLKLRAVDPVTHAELGAPFFVSINKQFARQLDRLEERDQLNVFVFKGLLTPYLRFNDEAMETDAFGRPTLVGPFAEFNFTVEPQGFSAVEDEEEAAGG